MRHQIFSAPNIRGFGLLQRERSFAAYQDMFNLYHLEPSVWVEPQGNWGDGDLHLVELSENYEGFDNIVAFWDPKNKPAPLQPCRFGYTLRWMSDTGKLSEEKVVSTRMGLDSSYANARQFVIDFDGPKLDAVPESDIPQAVANCSANAAIVYNQCCAAMDWDLARYFENATQGRQHRPGGPALHAAKGNQHFKRNLDLSMESAMTGIGALTDSAGHLAGRPLEEWNAAYEKVENYFHALRVRNKPLLGRALRALECAAHRAPAEPERSATQLAAEEMDRIVIEWFAEVLQEPPANADQMLSTRGRLALLLADMPGRWQEQFLRPGPWPEEFISAMRETYLRAGPDFQLSKMTPRPFDLGPITTLQNIGKFPYVRMLTAWFFWGLLLIFVFPAYACRRTDVLGTM